MPFILQLVDYISVLTGLARASVEDHLSKHWGEFDSNRDNGIDFSEFRHGLLPVIIGLHRHIQRGGRGARGGEVGRACIPDSAGPVPSVFSHPQQWFMVSTCSRQLYDLKGLD